MAVTNYHTVNGQIIAEETGGTRIDYLTDALGNVTATVDQSANLINTYRYKPYGGLLAKTGAGADPAFQWVGSQGYRQTGKSYSDVYIRARHYSSALGRWTSQDPIKHGLNWYRYTDNPITIIDPTGFISITCLQQKGISCCALEGNENTKICCECAKKEGFKNGTEWCRKIDDWGHKPEHCGQYPLCVLRHALGAKKYGDKNCKGKGDKCVHCMVACYLAFYCGVKEALCASWCKEMQDLSDCDSGSRFEIKDWEADKRGVGQSPPKSLAECHQRCKIYGA